MWGGRAVGEGLLQAFERSKGKGESGRKGMDRA